MKNSLICSIICTLLFMMFSCSRHAEPVSIIPEEFNIDGVIADNLLMVAKVPTVVSKEFAESKPVIDARKPAGTYDDDKDGVDCKRYMAFSFSKFSYN